MSKESLKEKVMEAMIATVLAIIVRSLHDD